MVITTKNKQLRLKKKKKQIINVVLHILVGYFSFCEVSNIVKGKITGVKDGSIAQEIGLKKGDILLSINGESLYDILDYKFNESDFLVELEIKHENGEVEIYEIEKDEGEELGIIFETELIDKPRNCYNKCIFCFMEQLPKNVRETLIFKDDDYRLSFFSGNYITLTNMKEFDIDRIIKYRLSPINISIHATDEKVRCMMLNNKNAGKVLKYLDKLYEAGITMNIQIVLCKGINDGQILDKTINDLSKYAPILKSICIVPVGLSDKREGLYNLELLDKDDSKRVIIQIEKYQRKFKKMYNTPLVFLADEFYLKADESFPDYEDYGEFGQIEDGIGMTPLFEHDFINELKRLKPDHTCQRDIILVVGKIVEQYMKEKAHNIQEKFPNVKIKVVAPVNNYFGKDITVTGLLTGSDIYSSLKNNLKEEEYVVICDVMLKDDEDIFLDNMKLEELQKLLNKKIIVTDGTAKCFIDAIVYKNSNKNIFKYNNDREKSSYENSQENLKF